MAWFIKIGLIINFIIFVWACIWQLKNLDDVKEGEIIATIFNTIYGAFWVLLLWPVLVIVLACSGILYIARKIYELLRRVI
jgi:hypothetical protein